MRLFHVKSEEFPYLCAPDYDDLELFNIPLNHKNASDYDLVDFDEFMLRPIIRQWLDGKMGPDFYYYDGLDGTLAFLESKDLMLFKLAWLHSTTCTALKKVNDLEETHQLF